MCTLANGRFSRSRDQERCKPEKILVTKLYAEKKITGDGFKKNLESGKFIIFPSPTSNSVTQIVEQSMDIGMDALIGIICIQNFSGNFSNPVFFSVDQEVKSKEFKMELSATF